MRKFLIRLLQILQKKNNTGTVARNTGYLFLSEVFLKAIGVLWIIFLAHTFSVENYGKYNLVTSFIAIFSFLPDLGVGIVVIREIAKNPKNSASILGNSFFLNIFLAVISFFTIIGSAIILGFDQGVLPFISIAAVTLFLSTIRSVAIFYFDGIEKMHLSAILNSLNSLLLIIFAGVGVLLGFGLFGVFFGMLIGTFISLVASWITLLKFIKPAFVFNFSKVIYFFQQGFPLGLASFAGLIYTKIDVLILSKFLGDSSVGIFSAATPFAFALIQLLNVPFVVAVFPALTRIHTDNKKRFRKGVVKSLTIIALWSISASTFISVFASDLIPLIFGNKYDQAIPILQVLIFFVPFISLSALLYKVLIILGKQKDYFIISIIGAIISVFSNILLIPLFGLYGAAFAAILTQAILFIIYSFDVYFRVYKK